VAAPAETTEEKQGPIGAFLSTYLAPVDSLAEVIFGLIMVLGWTSTARLVFGTTSVRQLLLAVIGCNLAWAIVDGVMYILSSVYERSQRIKLLGSLRRAPDGESAVALIAERLDEDLEPVLTDDQRAQVYHWLVAGAARVESEQAHVTREDMLGAVVSGVLVFVSVLPVGLPFLFISDPTVALRVSNLVCVGMLFIIGFYWARYIAMNRVLAGTLLLVVGLLMVAVTVALGG